MISYPIGLIDETVDVSFNVWIFSIKPNTKQIEYILNVKSFDYASFVTINLLEHDKVIRVQDYVMKDYKYKEQYYLMRNKTAITISVSSWEGVKKIIYFKVIGKTMITVGTDINFTFEYLATNPMSDFATPSKKMRKQEPEISTFSINKKMTIFKKRHFYSVSLRFYGDLPNFKIEMPYIFDESRICETYPSSMSISCPPDAIDMMKIKFNEMGWREE